MNQNPLTHAFFAELSKLAAAKKSKTSKSGLLKGIGLGLVASPLIFGGVSKIRAHYKANKTFKLLKRTNPHGVASSPNFAAQFKTLRNFSPKLAADPLAATSALKAMQSTGTDLRTLQDLASIQSGISERAHERRESFGEAGGRVADFL